MSPWWSWAIALLALTSTVLTRRRHAAGWAVAIACNLVWIPYGILARQPGFIVLEVVFIALNAYNLRLWLRGDIATGPPARRGRPTPPSWPDPGTTLLDPTGAHHIHTPGGLTLVLPPPHRDTP